jgi:sugar diacid utilization regulator
VLDGADLQEIAVAVAELTGKPTSIHDAQHRRLALAMPPSLDAAVVPRLLDAPFREHRAVVEALAGICGARGAVIGPLPAAGLPQRFLTAAVTMPDQEWGHLVVMEYGSRFGPLDMHIARRAATNIALELAAERRAAAAEWDARASLTDDLIRGNRDPGSLERRATYLGVDLALPSVLCLITGDPSDGEAVPTAAEVTAALAGGGACDGRVVATGVAEGVVALLPLTSDTSTMEAISGARERVDRALAGLERRGVAAALSTRCIQPADYVRAYGEVRQVMHCMRTLSYDGGPRVLTADDLGPGRLVLAASERGEAERFANDALGALLVEDDGTRDLLATLQVFFRCARSVRRSALELGVHENTIRYRLTRIEDLTGLAVGGSSDDQLTAQLALLVLRLEGMLAAPGG